MKKLSLAILLLISFTATGCTKTVDKEISDNTAIEESKEAERTEEEKEEESKKEETEEEKKEANDEKIPPIPKDFEGTSARWNPNTKKWEVPNNKLKTDEELGVVKLPGGGTDDIAGANKVFKLPSVVGVTATKKNLEHGYRWELSDGKTDLLLNKPIFYKIEIVGVDNWEQDGKVLKQYPAPGSKVRGYSEITLWVGQIFGSAAKPDVQIPNVVGENYYELKDTIYTLYLIGFDNVTYEKSDKPEGTILKQSKIPNTWVRPNTGIDIVVSKGK